MKKKIVGVIVAALFCIGLFSMLLFIKRERDISLHWLTENSRSQLDLMGDLLNSDLEKIKNQMAQIATLVEAGQNEEAQKSLGGFSGVAAINPETNDFIWKLQVPVEAGRPHVDEWSAQWVQKLREVKSDDTEIKFYSSQVREGEIRSAISVLAHVRDRKTSQVNKIRLIGIRTRALFQDLIDKLKDQGVHLFLTTQSGQTLAHTVSEYVGNSMVGDKNYEEIKSQKNTFGTILTKDARGEEILSFYLKIPNGKLTLISQWRKELWVATDWGFYGQILLISLALSLLAGALVFQFLKNIAKGEIRIREVPVEKIVERVVEKIVEKPVESIDKKSPFQSIESENAFKANDLNSNNFRESVEPINFENLPIPQRPQFAPGLSSSLKSNNKEPIIGNEISVPMKVLEKVVAGLRAPLLSVLGHVQMAKLNPQGGALQAIETEVRNAREVLDQVGHYSGLSQIPSITISLHEVVESSLRMVEGSIMRSHIKVVREIPPSFAIKCDIDEFKNALSALFRNSIEAMEKNLRKTLFIRATQKEHWVHLEIEDTGEGILSENLDKIFDPFYTTKSNLDHPGLGLSMASGVFRQHGAQVQVKSKVGEGTIFMLKIPLSKEIVQSLEKQSLLRSLPLFETQKNQIPEVENLTMSTTSTSQNLTSPVNQNPVIHRPTTMPLNSLPKETPSVSSNPIESIEVQDSDLSVFDSLNLFAEDDGDSEFQFGRLDFAESNNKGSSKKENYKNENYKNANSTKIETPKMSLGEKTAQEVLKSIGQTYTLTEEDLNNSSKKDSFTSQIDKGSFDLKSREMVEDKNPQHKGKVSPRLKKKDEPFAGIKVQIPRPEEKI